MIYSYAIIFLEFILGMIFIVKYGHLNKRSKKFNVFIILLLLLIVITRVYRYNSALGLDMDEAMGAVNSWSLGKYGIDYFNLAKNPVYLFAWGSGMNILYPLITVPLVKAFGLSMVVYRFPIVFLNLAGIFLFTFALLRTNLTNKTIGLITAIVFLSPWSMYSSRWAIESNLFPTMMIFVAATFILFYESRTHRNRLLALTLMTILIAFSAYAYSDNWLFLGLFVISLYSWLVIRKQISYKALITQLAGMLILVVPLLLFLYVNFIGHHPINFLGLTIPKLAAARSAFVISNGHIIKSIANNLYNVADMFVSGYDGIPKMALPVFGAFYPFMFLFGIIGIVKTIIVHPKNYLDTFMLIMLASNVLTVLLIEPMWIHYNALMLPILYFEAIGVKKVCQTRMELKIFAVLFAMMFLVSQFYYFNKYQDEFHNGRQNTPVELKAIVNRHKKDKSVYIVTDNRVNNMNTGAMFIIPIYYSHLNPYKFHQETLNVQKGEFMTYYDYGRWHIRNAASLQKRMKVNKKTTFIVQKGADTSHLPKHLKLNEHYKYYDVLTKN